MTVRDRFAEKGVRFHLTEAAFEMRSLAIKAVLFDWDGVFNDGFKDAEGGSPFSEVDSMGVNLLRFALWLRNDEKLPKAAIITGQHNAYAERFAERERFHGVYVGYTHKPEAFDAFLALHGLKAEEVAFFFDDVLDLPVAQRCGLRIMFGHSATHHFQQHVEASGLADITMPTGGGHHGLRQACELLIASWGEWERVVDHRVRYDLVYQRYLAARNAVNTAVQRNTR
jgi:3-deoxy-D-manno-octulosonate 8-phosphate phosphatase (KDO 8-P phosphatase)